PGKFSALSARSAAPPPPWNAHAGRHVTLNVFLVLSSNCRIVNVTISNARLLAVAAQALSQMLFGTLLLLMVMAPGCPASHSDSLRWLRPNTAYAIPSGLLRRPSHPRSVCT